MHNIARLPPEDREDLFTGTASKKGISEALIEKDFWVCLMLDYLFHECRWKDKLVFKGGTSLSKAYNLIERFSEDIDLILDWRVLGYSDKEPWINRSNTAQVNFNREANQRTESFLRDEFVPSLESDLTEKFSDDISVSIDDSEKQTVNINYPQSYSDDSILQEIRLEIGPLAAWTPSSVRQIKPYAAEYYPKIFSQPSTDILTVKPERTFWEKVTILHSEAFRSNDLPSRYSRHYYDVYCMSNTDVKDKALADLSLLDTVADFKKKFYPSNRARYDLAAAGTLKLLPPEHNMSNLAKDYEIMKSMFFGDAPEFSEVIRGLEKLEDEINSIQLSS